MSNKWSTEVILNKIDYRTKLREILRDKTNNELINTNIDNDITSKITKFCTKEIETLT